MSDDLKRALEVADPFAATCAALEFLTDAARKFEALARPKVESETGDFEATAAALARDLHQKAREVRALSMMATEEFKRILAGEPAPQPFRREPLRLVKEEAADALE